MTSFFGVNDYLIYLKQIQKAYLPTVAELGPPHHIS